MKANAQLRQYGITPASIRSLRGTPTPALLDYLDLVEPRREHALLPDGVAEAMGRPLLFFVDESQPSLSVDPSTHEENFADLRRRVLASRGDRAYLARILPGELRVVPVSLAERTPEWKIFRAGTGEASIFFSRLALGKFDGQGEPQTPDFLFREMFDLLIHGADDLAQTLDRADVLSLIGRALFFRFLRDRKIVKDKDTLTVAPKAMDLLSCFDNSENAASTSRWLDITFNGDFLPLTDDGNQAFFDSIGRKTNGTVFSHLSAILRGGTPVASARYQLRFNWGDFDFAHVPIGLLSQVYEALCWKWEHRTAKETSVYYTPRNIAAALVDEAFDKMPDASTCRVLDPACGAGVFLVLAFRRLYREQWKETHQRPNTRMIRETLERQITGFDISDAALKLSALSLYLTAIELDPEPIPPGKLKFKRLQGTVLHNFRREHESNDSMVIGSLGLHVDKSYDGKFDIVASNPPWTSLPLTQKSVAIELEKASRAIVSRKCAPAAHSYHNPDNAPDLPFFWKSTEWCRPGGRIAMALPARILLKHEGIPRYARETILRTIEITGIINGSNLSDTQVWPAMQQPFILIFARNRRPSTSHVIRLITLYNDIVLNQRGQVRIDSKSAQPVEIDAIAREPWLYKALTIGTPLDVDLVRKLIGAGGRPFSSYWHDDLGLVSSNGYQIKEKQRQRDASRLKVLLNLNSTHLFRFIVDESKLSLFSRDTLFRTRIKNRAQDKLRVYRGPLALVKEAPGPHREEGWALLSPNDVAYNESFHGYSAAGHPLAEILVRYVHLFVHSHIWTHYALLTSPKFGVERRKFYKKDLDECPIIPLERLSSEVRQIIMSLSQRLEREDTTVFQEIDEFFGNLYGLDELDLEVLRDTLEVCLPYDESRERACEVPSSVEREIFCGRLYSLLLPFFEILRKELEVFLWNPVDQDVAEDAPFSVLFIGERRPPPEAFEDLFQEQILPLANETGTTQIIFEVEGGLIVGILNQYRYWTPSRARLLTAEVLRLHAGVFEK